MGLEGFCLLGMSLSIDWEHDMWPHTAVPICGSRIQVSRSATSECTVGDTWRLSNLPYHNIFVISNPRELHVLNHFNKQPNEPKTPLLIKEILGDILPSSKSRPHGTKCNSLSNKLVSPSLSQNSLGYANIWKLYVYILCYQRVPYSKKISDLVVLICRLLTTHEFACYFLNRLIKTKLERYD